MLPKDSEPRVQLFKIFYLKYLKWYHNRREGLPKWSGTQSTTTTPSKTTLPFSALISQWVWQHSFEEIPIKWDFDKRFEGGHRYLCASLHACPWITLWGLECLGHWVNHYKKYLVKNHILDRVCKFSFWVENSSSLKSQNNIGNFSNWAERHLL